MPEEKRGSGETGYHKETSIAGDNGCVGGKDGQPCNGFIIQDTDRCYFHTHPQARHKLKQEKAARELVAVIDDSVFNHEYDGITAIEALQREMFRTQHIVKWLGMKLDVMAKDEPELLAMIVTSEKEEIAKQVNKRTSITNQANIFRRQMVTTANGLNPFVTWFIKEREHLTNICRLLVSVGIKLDEIQLSQSQGSMMIEAMQQFAVSMGHDPAEQSTVDALLKSLELVRDERAHNSLG